MLITFIASSSGPLPFPPPAQIITRAIKEYLLHHILSKSNVLYPRTIVIPLSFAAERVYTYHEALFFIPST